MTKWRIYEQPHFLTAGLFVLQQFLHVPALEAAISSLA